MFKYHNYYNEDTSNLKINQYEKIIKHYISPFRAIEHDRT